MNIPFPRLVTEGWHAILTVHLGPEGATLAETVLWIGGVILGAVFIRYIQLLGQGGRAPDSLERRDYDGLRRSLIEGGWPSRVYGQMLTRLLDGVDRFFGDVNAVGYPRWRRSAFPRAFGLKTPASLWTASAYRRCLLLALIYPLASVFAIWIISGKVGPVEAWLRMKSDVDPLARGTALCAVGGAFFAWRNFAKTSSNVRWVLAVVGLFLIRRAIEAGGGAAALACALAGPAAATGAGAGAIAGAVGGSIAYSLAVDSSGAGPITKMFGRIIHEINVTLMYLNDIPPSQINLVSSISSVSISFVVSPGLGGAIKYICDYIIKRNFEDRFYIFYTSGSIVSLLTLAYYSENIKSLVFTLSPFMIFLGLLSLVNAPFDWISIGLTRGLLRRGVELKGWWPYGLAFIDCVGASGLLFALAAAMIVGVQAFDDLAALRGAPPVLPIPALLDGMARNPGAPEYWWVYATLFSTLIPSVFNLVIGAWSLTRGLPWVSRAMARALPDGQAVPIYNCWLVAMVLTSQWAFGAILPLAAFALLAWGAPRLFPAIGHVFLDYARLVAGLDIPRGVIEWALHLFGRR